MSLLHKAVMLLGILLIFCRIGLADAIVSVQPSESTTSPGSSITLSVAVNNVADLYAFQFDIGFDPSVLSATAISEGSFLPTGGTTIFIPGLIDNVGGTITFNADTLTGPISGVTGGGTLAILSFNVIGLGTSPVSLANVILLDSQGNDIPFTTADGSVLSQVPEPVTLLLCTASFPAFLLRHRRR